MKSKRTKACDVSHAVRNIVLERDQGRCIFCGISANLTMAHFVGRARGGLGIEQNLVTACMKCHTEADQGAHTKEYHKRMYSYLKNLYPDMNPRNLIYRK